MKFTNRNGEEWDVEESESDRMDMGGFLMTHKHRSKVKLNSRLSNEDKNRGRKSLFGRLFDRKVGGSGVDVWNP